MLSIYGKKAPKGSFCDGISRRGVLKIGALGIGAFGLNMADILRAEAKSGCRPYSGQMKYGGPSNQFRQMYPGFKSGSASLKLLKSWTSPRY